MKNHLEGCTSYKFPAILGLHPSFAAATITKAEPMATGFSAVKSGIVMFIIPFVFAIYPEILLIDAAVVDPTTGASGEVGYLPGYDGNVAWGALAAVLLRLVLALYLISSALSAFDTRRLALWEVLVRLGLAVLILFRVPEVFGPAAVAALILVGWHRYAPRALSKAG